MSAGPRSLVRASLAPYSRANATLFVAGTAGSWFYACDVQRLAGTSSREQNVRGFRTLSRDELLTAAAPAGLLDSLDGREGRVARRGTVHHSGERQQKKKRKAGDAVRVGHDSAPAQSSNPSLE